MLKILTWNLARPSESTRTRNNFFVKTIKEINPDIAILTETNKCIQLGDEYFVDSSNKLPEYFQGVNYKKGERRLSIYSKHFLKYFYPTKNNYNTLLTEIDSPFGPLMIFGTVVGYMGGRHKSFLEDFKSQMYELAWFQEKPNFCYAGDLNVSFSGYTYPSHEIRDMVTSKLESLDMEIVSRDIKDSVIHTVISKNFLKGREVEVSSMDFDKKMTDHNLVLVTIK